MGSFRNLRDNRARRSVQTTWWGCDLLSSTWNHGAIWSASRLVPACEWNLTERRVVSSGVGKGEREMRAERQRENIDASHTASRRRGLWMHCECNIEVSEVGRSTRSLARGRHRRYTLTHKWRFGVLWESAAVLLQDQLLTGYWRGQAAWSVQGRRSINAACRGVPPTKHTVHTC